MYLSKWTEWIKENTCKSCHGMGWIEVPYPKKKQEKHIICETCNGYELILPKLKRVNQDVFFDVHKFRDRYPDGQGWMAFVDWELLGIDLKRLMGLSMIERHPNKPPTYGNYRDDFPEIFYSLTLNGRLLLRYPTKYLKW